MGEAGLAAAEVLVTLAAGWQNTARQAAQSTPAAVALAASAAECRQAMGERVEHQWVLTVVQELVGPAERRPLDMVPDPEPVEQARDRELQVALRLVQLVVLDQEQLAPEQARGLADNVQVLRPQARAHDPVRVQRLQVPGPVPAQQRQALDPVRVKPPQVCDLVWVKPPQVLDLLRMLRQLPPAHEPLPALEE